MADMIENPESVGAIQQRLKDLHLAYSRMLDVEKSLSQTEFARRMKMTPQAWRQVTAVNRIDIETAYKVCDLTGVDLNYIYRGWMTLVPEKIALHLREIEDERRRKKHA